jgi:ATP-dependent RNA helicase RhlE
VNFNSFAFHPRIHSGISSAGFTTPTPIQTHTIPLILDRRDVVGLAQTGTGKTAAFVLPILQRLVDGPRGRVRALIVSPTRELAEQTHTTIGKLGRHTRIRSAAIYGGVSINRQKDVLRAGVEIVVACPGRLLDLMGQGVINLNAVEMVVLDEADQMFDMGFFPDIRRILAALPKSRQTLLFSATMPDEIRLLANEFLHQPATVDLDVSRPVETVGHEVYRVEQAKKNELLLAILRKSGNSKVLVFTRTKHRAKKLAEQLVRAGLPAASLQGNLSQNRRQEAMDKFRSGQIRILVATDIASRGIDVSKISHVINYDLPDTAVAYTHRIGRTGRMTELGTALSFATQEDIPMVRTIERLLARSLKPSKLAWIDTR